VIVAESPPVSGLYFYYPLGKIEPLFAALMSKLLLSVKPKKEGLIRYATEGLVVSGCNVEQVDKNKRRDETIARNYPMLCGDLTDCSRTRRSPGF